MEEILFIKNVISVHKKNDKQLINNYRPVSLLPIFGKMFERIIFNKIYRYLDEHNLLNLTNQDLDQRIHVYTSY